MARAAGASVTVTHDLNAIAGADVIYVDDSGGATAAVAAFLHDWQVWRSARKPLP